MSRIGSLLFSLPFSVAGTVALAEEVTFADGKGYVGLETGLVMLGDVGWSISGSGLLFGLDASGTISGEYQYDRGIGFGGVVGYRMTDWLTAEVEAAYSTVEYDKLTISGNGTIDGRNYSISQTVDIDGEITSVSGLVNMLITPRIGITDSVRPFVGIGAGFLSYDEEIDSIDGVATSGSVSDTAFAYQFKTGLDVDVSDSFSLGASYSYVGAETGDSITDDATIQRLMLRGVLKF